MQTNVKSKLGEDLRMSNKPRTISERDGLPNSLAPSWE